MDINDEELQDILQDLRSSDINVRRDDAVPHHLCPSSIGHKIIFNPCMIENVDILDPNLQSDICKKHVFCT